AEALPILRKLSEWGERRLNAAEADRLGIVAAQVFRATSDLGALIAEAGNLKLFSGTDCRDREEIRLSWKDITEHHRRKVLFVKPSPMAYQLQEALVDESIILIELGLAQAIFSETGEKPAQCREGQLLAALATTEKPKLAGVKKREKLFRTLLEYR